MRITVLLALAALGLFVSGAQADSVQFDNVTNGGVIIQLLLNGSAMTGWGYIGQYNWTVEQNGSALGPNGSHFFTFCIDITQDIASNGNYNYTLTNPANAPKPNSTYMNGPMGADNAAALGRLWAADIGNVLNATSVANELEAAAAFQVAVWKITYNKAPDNLNINDALDKLTIQLYTPQCHPSEPDQHRRIQLGFGRSEFIRPRDAVGRSKQPGLSGPDHHGPDAGCGDLGFGLNGRTARRPASQAAPERLKISNRRGAVSREGPNELAQAMPRRLPQAYSPGHRFISTVATLAHPAGFERPPAWREI